MSETQHLAKTFFEDSGLKETIKNTVWLCLRKYGPLACFEMEEKKEIGRRTKRVHEAVSGVLKEMRYQKMTALIYVDGDEPGTRELVCRRNPETDMLAEIHRALPREGWQPNVKPPTTYSTMMKLLDVIRKTDLEWAGGAKEPSSELRREKREALSIADEIIADHYERRKGKATEEGS